MLRHEASSTYSPSSLKITASWRIASLEALENYQLRVVFMDGLAGIVDFSSWLHNPSLSGTIFEALRDQKFFEKAYLELGAVTWPNGADLAPDAMYDAIRQGGRWVLK